MIARREVSCTLAFNFLAPSVIAVQVAAAGTGGDDRAEELSVVWGSDAEALPVVEVAGAHHGRVHIVEAPEGPVTLRYSCTLAERHDAEPASPAPSSRFEEEVIAALRPSRYCPSDVLGPFAHTEFGSLVGTAEVAAAVAGWVSRRISYQLGSSDHTDSAVDTLLLGRGVCRDFGHLMIALCRALGVPARLVSVYAPGLVPMDFHAVVEVWSAGRWLVVDPTGLAPRSSLVRIATGRDAADTSFVTTIEGNVELVATEVYAFVDGPLPGDDHVAGSTLGIG